MFYFTTKDMRQAAVIFAAGYPVEVRRDGNSPRCLFEIPDNPATRELLEDYEMRRSLVIPPKQILQAYAELITRCKAVKSGGAI